MADGTSRQDPGGERETGRDKGGASAEEAALAARLRRLEQRLGDFGAGQTAETARRARADGDASGMARGLKLSAELVGGVIVGTGLGWLFDRALGTSPWGFIGFLLLGFAAGVLSVVRSAGVVPGSRPEKPR